MTGLVVDTCVLLDIFEGVEPFATQSADILDVYADRGLFIAPITYVELAPAFRGDLEGLDDFIHQLGISISAGEQMTRIKAAAQQWHQYVALKRQGMVAKRPMADLLIGTCAASHEGLITRNAKDFRQIFPTLMLIEP